MHLTTLPLFLVATASLATALPNYGTPSKQTPRVKDKDASTPAKQDIINVLAGTYQLVNTSSTHNNVPIPDLPYGNQPVGIITYSKSGYMSATITATEPALRPNLTFPFQSTDSDRDWALVGKHGVAYAGPFRISDDVPANLTHGQLFHGPLTVANVPTWQGADHRRNYTIVKQDGVTWLQIGSERGGGYRGVLWWRRID